MSDYSEQALALISRLVALQLWEIGAIKINPGAPFKLVSGNYSPIYVNCREVISSVVFADVFAAAIRLFCNARKIMFDIVAGGETAGIPLAAFLSRSLGVPMVYIRKQTKDHGVARRVEGTSIKGRRVLLVEDLITDAGSKISFLNAIRAAGGNVGDVLVIFDRLQGGEAALREHGTALHAITNLDVALKEAESVGLIGTHESALLKNYLASPKKWHEERGLAFHE